MATNTPRPIVVGGKSTANYAMAVVTRHAAGERSFMLRARGRFISAAVDAANMAMKMGLPLRRETCVWGEEVGPEGKPVSFVEIQLVSA